MSPPEMVPGTLVTVRPTTKVMNDPAGAGEAGVNVTVCPILNAGMFLLDDGGALPYPSQSSAPLFGMSIPLPAPGAGQPVGATTLVMVTVLAGLPGADVVGAGEASQLRLAMFLGSQFGNSQVPAVLFKARAGYGVNGSTAFDGGQLLMKAEAML